MNMEAINNMRIFLVDDDSFCINIYKQHLYNLGYNNVSSFENGADCLNSLSFNPDVIFLDHGMDSLTGLEVLKKIKIYNRNIFVVFLSGEANLLTAVKALKLGAIKFIAKGFYDLQNIEKILNIIKQVTMTKRKKLSALLDDDYNFQLNRRSVA